jgi:hypothetical protein
MIGASMLIVLLLVIATFVCLNEVGGDAKRRWTLRRVEHGDSSACPCAEVVHPAARAKAARNAIDGTGNIAEPGIYRLERASVFRMHQLDELECRQRVDLVGSWMDAFAHGLMTSAAASAHTRAAPLVVM